MMTRGNRVFASFVCSNDIYHFAPPYFACNRHRLSEFVPDFCTKVWKLDTRFIIKTTRMIFVRTENLNKTRSPRRVRTRSPNKKRYTSLVYERGQNSKARVCTIKRGPRAKGARLSFQRAPVVLSYEPYR